MKKSTTTKRARRSSSSSFDNKRFVSADVEAYFHDSVKRRFEIDSPYLLDFETIIKQRGWQEFCKPPKAATMTIVCEFYANAFKGPASISTVRERQIRYDVRAINAILKIHNSPHEID